MGYLDDRSLHSFESILKYDSPARVELMSSIGDIMTDTYECMGYRRYDEDEAGSGDPLHKNLVV